MQMSMKIPRVRKKKDMRDNIRNSHQNENHSLNMCKHNRVSYIGVQHYSQRVFTITQLIFSRFKIIRYIHVILTSMV